MFILVKNKVLRHWYGVLYWDLSHVLIGLYLIFQLHIFYKKFNTKYNFEIYYMFV